MTLVTVKKSAVAQLPFTYNSGRADIETTAGITQEGLGTDYTSAGSPKLKFDGTGDNIVICFGSQADELSYDIKGNPKEKANGGIGIIPYVYKDALNYKNTYKKGQIVCANVTYKNGYYYLNKMEKVEV